MMEATLLLAAIAQRSGLSLLPGHLSESFIPLTGDGLLATTGVPKHPLPLMLQVSANCPLISN
jgi:hypothetical protein